LQPDGKIIIGGKFTSYNGINENCIMRLNNDGTKDTNFNTGAGFNYFVSSITVGLNSEIMVGGAFTTYNNSNASSYFIKLNGNSILSNNGITKDSISYYPNPVDDVLNINLATELNNIKIFNIQGQSIFQKLYNSKSVQINTSEFPTGIYIVTVEVEGKKESFKVFKK
jgi:hypothetical protein